MLDHLQFGWCPFHSAETAVPKAPVTLSSSEAGLSAALLSSLPATSSSGACSFLKVTHVAVLIFVLVWFLWSFLGHSFSMIFCWIANLFSPHWNPFLDLSFSPFVTDHMYFWAFTYFILFFPCWIKSMFPLLLKCGPIVFFFFFFELGCSLWK